jgi:hypothetical protein
LVDLIYLGIYWNIHLPWGLPHANGAIDILAEEPEEKVAVEIETGP